MSSTHRLHSTSQLHSPSVHSLNETIGSLKTSITRGLAAKYAGRLPAALVRRAVDDAEELARSTGFAHLFFPELAEEKVRILSIYLTAETNQRAPHGLQFAA